MLQLCVLFVSARKLALDLKTRFACFLSAEPSEEAVISCFACNLHSYDFAVLRGAKDGHPSCGKQTKTSLTSLYSIFLRDKFFVPACE